jgi:hypothetical protein
MAWARGHKSDWDFFAAETGDKAGSCVATCPQPRQRS